MTHTDNKIKENNIETYINPMAIMLFQAANLLAFLWKENPYGELVT